MDNVALAKTCQVCKNIDLSAWVSAMLYIAHSSIYCAVAVLDIFM